MASYTVNVSGIARTTTKQHLHDFFTFCGKIVDIHRDDLATTATIHFEKPSAAKTALMLNGGTLDGSQLSVTSDHEHPDEADEPSGANGPAFHQSDKPRAAIAAEYLAKGYTLSDSILQRAIEIDNKQGISSRFLSYFHSLDQTLGSKALGPDQTISGKVTETVGVATERAKTIDEQQGISKTAGDYYSKAIASPFGQRVLQFYTTTSKQVLDIHEEARRIAEQQKASQAATGSATSAPGSGPVSGQAPTVV